MIRGGSFSDDQHAHGGLRMTYRVRYWPEGQVKLIGFRLVIRKKS
jgi:formylglycine-generating enzyme required for sulfatase activity